jgi:hypothetical protein
VREAVKRAAAFRIERQQSGHVNILWKLPPACRPARVRSRG